MNYLVTQEAVTTSSAELAAIDAAADAVIAAAAQLQSGLDAYAQFIGNSFENEMSVHDATNLASAHYTLGLFANNYRGASAGALARAPALTHVSIYYPAVSVVCWDPNHNQAATTLGNYVLVFEKGGVTYNVPASTVRGGPGAGVTAVSVWESPSWFD